MVPLSSEANGVRLSALTLPPGSLAAGSQYVFSLQACFTLAPSAAPCASVAVQFAAANSPLTVALAGAVNAVVGEASGVALDASSAADPDREAGPIVVSWSCRLAAQPAAPCLGPSGARLAFAAAPAGSSAFVGMRPVQTLYLAGSDAGSQYVISVNVTKGRRSTVASTSVTVRSGPLPVATVRPPASARITGNVTISGRVAPPAGSTVTLVAWTQLAGPTQAQITWQTGPVAAAASATSPQLPRPDGAGGPSSPDDLSTVLSVAGESLTPGGTYAFRLGATAPEGTATSDVSFTVAQPPRGEAGAAAGSLTVSPASGVAAATPFTLSAGGWLADGDDAPLEFQFEYAGPPSSDGSAAPVVVVQHFDAAQFAPFRVPWERRTGSAPVMFLLSARNRHGLVTTATAQATVEWPALDSEGAQADLVRSVAAAASSALLSGQPALAMSAADGLASLLNSFSSGPAPGSGGGAGVEGEGGGGAGAPQPSTPSAAAQEAQAERARQRADLLGVLSAATALSPPTSRGSVQAISAIASIVSVPTELTVASQNAALSLMGSVMSSGAAIPAAAADSVVKSLSRITGNLLSSIAVAHPRSPPQAAGQPAAPPAPASSRQALLQVMSVLGAVRNSQVQQAIAARAPAAGGSNGDGGSASAPAAALLSIQTEHIRMSVHADSVGPNSRIFSEALSAPGSTAAFEALPGGVAAALAAAGGSTVVTEFLSLSFKCDPAPSFPFSFPPCFPCPRGFLIPLAPRAATTERP